MMISIIILAIIQGFAEFLPISSSAHLIIFRELFGLGSSIITDDISLTFDVALHFGTALAIIVYFFKDFLNMAIKGFSKGLKDNEGKMMWFIIFATIPVGIIGILFEDKVEEIIRSKYIIIALALIIMGLIIYIADKKCKSTKTLKTMKIEDALIIGCSQIFALIPGFSRSGTTIAASRLLKINREDSARFSFYLSCPVVLGAVFLEFISVDFNIILSNLLIFIVGIIVAFVSGIVCIKFLLKYLHKNDFKIFMYYRIALGLFVIAYVLFF